MVQSKVRQAIFAKLAEVEDLLLEATCEGKQFAELDCYEDVDVALAHLLEQLGYYLD